MFKKFLCSIIMLLMSVFVLEGLERIVLSETWQHEDSITGRIQFSVIDKDGNVVATFFKTGQRLITPKGVFKIVPWGQGPDELTNVWAICPYKDGKLAFAENPGKVKIFKKEGNDYSMDQIIWFKRGMTFQAFCNTVYHKNHWYFVGIEILEWDKNSAKISYIRIYDDSGRVINRPIVKTISSEVLRTNMLHEMRRYVLAYGDKVFFLSENELKVVVLSADSLKVEKEIVLPSPAFYKKMPQGFFVRDKKNKSAVNRSVQLENWLTSYSRITKAVIANDMLVLQIRTCDKNLKKFALLFYDSSSFQPEKTIFIDDLLLGARNGKLFFFGGGDPGLDDEFENTVINIFQIK